MITQSMILEDIPNIREDLRIKKAKRCKEADRYFDWYGIDCGYPMCCVLWFCFEDCSIRVKVPEYDTTMFQNERILCPDCLILRLKKLDTWKYCH